MCKSYFQKSRKSWERVPTTWKFLEKKGKIVYEIERNHFNVNNLWVGAASRHFRREFVLGMKKENYDDEELF